MFLKRNQGFSQTYRKKKKEQITKTKPKKKVTPPKTCVLVLIMVYAK